MIEIAVLITCFNRKEKTLKCLDCLYAQLPIEGYEVDVYLTNDGCTDGTPEVVSERYPKVHIINGDGNLYWNRGMYTAWKVAAETRDYDFYLWLNDDTLTYSHTLETLLDSSKSRDNKSIIVGTTCATNNPSIITYGGRKINKGLLPASKNTIECDYFNGNIILIPKYVYQQIGMNDPRFRHALGDFDYGMRASKLGIKSIIAPNILGECDEHESLPTWCNPQKPFNKRWQAFRTPLGHDPEEFFIYEFRHHGLTMACFHYLTNHLRVICPYLW